MSRIKIIKPYTRRPLSMNTLAGSLYKEGLSRAPMTALTVFPMTDAKGVIQTGLDENSIRIRSIKNEEARNAEIERVKSLRETLELRINEDLSPGSPFWKEKMENPYPLKDGDNVFDLDDANQAIDYYWITQLPIIAKSLSDIQSGKVDPTAIAYYVYEPDVESTREFNRKKVINDLVVTLNKLDEVEIKKVAFLLNLKLSNKSTYNDYYVALDNFIREPKAYGKEDPIEEFKVATSYTPEVLAVKVLIKQLLEERILKHKGISIFEGENLVAKSEADFEIQLLEDPERLISYEAKVRAKKQFIDNI